MMDQSEQVIEPVRVGIIGCGVIGQVHVQYGVGLPDVEIKAVADIRLGVAQAVAEQYGISTVYPDAQSLLNDPQIEAVVLAMPAHLRTDLACQAFAAGKHVLTEKPVAMNAAEVRRLIAARGILVAGCCSSRYHFLESSQVAADFIASGALGPLRLIRCRALRPAGPPPTTPPPAWRLSKALNGGGILMNWGCYDLDYLLGLTGWSLKPEIVLAQTWPIAPQLEAHIAPGSDAETYVTALIRCADGVVISYERGEYMAAQTDEAWAIVGTQGSLRLQMTPRSDKVIWHDQGTGDQGLQSTPIWQGDEGYETLHPGPLRDFAQAIRQDRPPQTSLERALIIQAITDAIYTSAASGEAISFEVD